jgi:malonyl-CoA O-methyltransferase
MIVDRPAHSAPVETLPAREAYRLWAPQYGAETAVSTLEDAGVLRVTPPLSGRALLDAGCGIGRRLPRTARVAIGVDLVFEMLAQHRVSGGAASATLLAAGDVRALPIRAAAFDVLWCRLVLGHVPDLVPAFRELARVAAPGATLIVSDFHPGARAAGHTRTFRDESGRTHVVEHHDHGADRYIAVAARNGWTLQRQLHLEVGPSVRPIYERAGALERYREQVGMKLVILFVFGR